MGRIVVTEFVSLDGVMEEPRAWTFQFDRGEDGDRFKSEELFGAEALLLGRVTYQLFAAAWPAMDGDEFGKRMNSIPKYVVSSTLSDSEASWGTTTVLRGDVVAEMAALRSQPGGDRLVHGSAQLVHTLAQHGLVDEYRLMVFPIVLGAGERLFPDAMPDPTELILTEAKTTGSGVLLLTYRPAATGEPDTDPARSQRSP
jgi:dihydrofolate reductase